MKKIMYIMHVDWNWIKQRPHFLAEGLGKHYDVQVFYSYSKKRFNLVRNSYNNIMLNKFITIPLRKNNMILYSVNKMLLKVFFQYYIRKYNPDYIWITFPELYEYIPQTCTSKIIYDCMDDATAFYSNKEYTKNLEDVERKLICNSEIVFVSSENLLMKLAQKYDNSHKLKLIRNAYNGYILNSKNKESNKLKIKSLKIGYIGTISSWFDFETIKFTLDHFNDIQIEYHLIGPVDDKINKPNDERIIFYGSINHNELYKFVRELDCLIMPFKINDLILSVDPVKLYEYINFNKPIISVFYNEIKRFDTFVYFYNDKDELANIIYNFANFGFSKKYSKEQRLSFLKENCWDSRIDEIINIIE